MNDNQWHHIAVTLAFDTSGANDTMKVYIDGDLAKGYVVESVNVNQYANVAANFIVTLGYRGGGNAFAGALADVPEFARAPGGAAYAANTTVNLGGVEAKYVKLTITATWGGVAPQTGLSEVRFSYIPVQARAPQPATAATGVPIDTALDWRPGREAASHKVFFGVDPAAVAAGTAPAKTVTDHGFDPGALNFGTTYYWRVDEVNAVTYPGEVWSFTTQEYAAVDDRTGKTKTVVHPNAAATTLTAWTEWRIPLSDLTGVNVAAVKKITLGVGDKASPKAGPAGILFIDDIQFGHPVP